MSDTIDLNEPIVPVPDAKAGRLSDDIGTSTAPDEAILRDIGRHAFGIRYPMDVTPRRIKRLRTETKPQE